MKIPPGILDPKGQAAKGVVYLEANGDDVREYGLTVDGNHSTCYVLVAPEDVITANLSVNSGVSAEFADLVVDGVLRNTWPNTRGARILRYAFDRAVYTGVQIGETKKWKTYAKMKVIERDSFKDLYLTGEQKASKVGSIEVQIFRKEDTEDATAPDASPEIPQGDVTKHGSGSGNGSGDATGGDATGGGETKTSLPNLGGVCQREPDFKKYPTWQDRNTHINTDITAPSFEIGFFEGNKHYSKPNQRILETYNGDYKIWTSFAFLLRSTAELRALGYDNVPLRGSPTLATNIVQSEADGAKASKADNAVLAALQDDTEETLFVPEGEDEPVQPVVEPKKAATKKKRKKVGPTEEPTTSTILGVEDNAKEDKVAAEAIAATAATAEESKTQPQPESKPEDERPETKEERIDRKKFESVLPGVKSAPAHQAYLQRAPTEEPEEMVVVDDNDDMEATPATQIESGVAKDLADDMQSAPASPTSSRSQATSMHVRNRSSTPSISMMRTPSVPNNVEISTSSTPDFLVSSHSGQAPPGYRRRRRLSGSAVSSFAPPNPYNRGSQTYNIPPFSGPLPAPIARMSPTNVPERLSSLLSMTSESRPSTPPNRQVQIYSSPGSPGFSGTSSPMNVPQLPFNRPVSGFSQVSPQSYHTSSEWNISSTLGSSREPMKATGLHTSDSNFQIHPNSEASKTESRVTTRTLTPKTTIDQKDVYIQPEPQDVQKMQGTGPSSSSLPPSELRTAPEQEEVEMFETTKISSQRQSEVETEIATQPNEVQWRQASRPSSTSPSEISTTPTEVATETAIETSRKSSQKEGTSTSNDRTTSRAALPRQSFHHTEESPILGSSQRLLAAYETTSMKPATTQARYTKGGSVVYDPVLTSLKNDGETPTVQPKQVTRPVPAETTLLSPPSSAQKRKASNISGENLDATMQPRKIPYNSPYSKSHAKGGSFQGNACDLVIIAMGDGDEEALGSVPAFKSDGKEHRWENEILRLEQVARVRKAAAEQQRMELQAQYRTALQMQSQREKVNKLHEEAERMERENAKMQATIARLYRGDSV